MLSEYIQAAMRRAHYELLEDGTYYGEIDVCPGVYANTDTLEGCREELREILEEWIVLGLRLNHNLPDIGGFKLDIAAEVG